MRSVRVEEENEIALFYFVWYGLTPESGVGREDWRTSIYHFDLMIGCPHRAQLVHFGLLVIGPGRRLGTEINEACARLDSSATSQ